MTFCSSLNWYSCIFSIFSSNLLLLTLILPPLSSFWWLLLFFLFLTLQQGTWTTSSTRRKTDWQVARPRVDEWVSDWSHWSLATSVVARQQQQQQQQHILGDDDNSDDNGGEREKIGAAAAVDVWFFFGQHQQQLPQQQHQKCSIQFKCCFDCDQQQQQQQRQKRQFSAADERPISILFLSLSLSLFGGSLLHQANRCLTAADGISGVVDGPVDEILLASEGEKERGRFGHHHHYHHHWALNLSIIVCEWAAGRPSVCRWRWWSSSSCPVLSCPPPCRSAVFSLHRSTADYYYCYHCWWWWWWWWQRAKVKLTVHLNANLVRGKLSCCCCRTVHCCCCSVCRSSLIIHRFYSADFHSWWSPHHFLTSFSSQSLVCPFFLSKAEILPFSLSNVKVTEGGCSALSSLRWADIVDHCFFVSNYQCQVQLHCSV